MPSGGHDVESQRNRERVDSRTAFSLSLDVCGSIKKCAVQGEASHRQEGLVVVTTTKKYEAPRQIS